MTTYKELAEQLDKKPKSKIKTEKEEAYEYLELFREESKRRLPKDFDIEKALDEALREKYGEITRHHK